MEYRGRLTLSSIPVAHTTTPWKGLGQRSTALTSCSESKPRSRAHSGGVTLRLLFARSAGAAGRNFTFGTYIDF